MPEGPEVTIMTRCLRAHLLDATLTGLTVIKESFKKKTSGFDSLVLPQKVLHVNNKGKFTYIVMENGQAIGISYGMTGGVRLATCEDRKHLSVKFTYNNDQDIFYNSIRNFGSVTVFTQEELNQKLEKLGPFVLDDEPLPEDKVVKIFRKHNKKNITVVLMNQNVFSGIGNYIKSECMYAAAVNPNSIVSELTDEQLIALYMGARRVSQRSLEIGGASLYTYTGEDGVTVTDFKSTLCVYNKELDPDGREVMKIQTPDKRSTFWVPSLQEK